MGFKNIYNLKGGLRKWIKKYPLDESKIKKESENLSVN
jgi:rhodanese-related sulfurtransferase